MITAETISEALGGKPYKDGFMCLCPAHADTKPSLTVIQKDRKILFHCFAGCEYARIVDALEAKGLRVSNNGNGNFNIVQTYDFQDPTGKMVYQECRLDPKDFRLRRPDPAQLGKFIWNLTGVTRYPYRVSQVIKANIVFVVEGPKDADRLAAMGFAATTNAGGANTPWPKTHNQYFKNKQTIILPDNDTPGKAYALDVARNLRTVAASVKVVELPGLPEKGDVSDWLKAGGTKEQLLALVEKAPEWQPKAVPDSPPQVGESQTPEIPKIITTKKFLNDKSNEAINALETANHPPFTFRRSGSLARISLDEKDHPRIETITDIQLRGILARCAHFLKETEKGLVATSPPMDLVKDILAQGEWKFPALEGIIQAPAMRLDGTVFNVPGYDPQTRLFYVKPPDLFVPDIPENPPQEALKDSLDYLLEILCDFPFVEDSDRANALGLLITLPLRPTIAGNVPMAVITAPAPGTGKSLLQDTVALIGTGKSAPMAGLPRDDDEMRKFITSRLLAGDPLISFDNLELPLWGPSLSRALTCTEWEDRVLGGNTTARLSQRAVWVCNGNNLKLRGDLPRRTFPIRLDARLAKPWERENFKHRGLAEWILRYRGDFLAAILTIARAWFVAGKPEPKKAVPVMGGFEGWAKIIGGILSFAGVEGFLENLSQFHDEADLEGPEWEGFLNTWIEVIGESAKTCQEVAAILRDNSEFASVLPDNLRDVLQDPEKSFERTLGRALARKEKRPYGENNLALQRDRTRDKVTLWRVGPLQSAGVS